jgi:hypothetical protein
MSYIFRICKYSNIPIRFCLTFRMKLRHLCLEFVNFLFWHFSNDPKKCKLIIRFIAFTIITYEMIFREAEWKFFDWMFRIRQILKTIFLYFFFFRFGIISSPFLVFKYLFFPLNNLSRASKVQPFLDIEA